MSWIDKQVEAMTLENFIELLDEAVNYACESGLTYAQVVGAFELVKYDVMVEAAEVGFEQD